MTLGNATALMKLIIRVKSVLSSKMNISFSYLVCHQNTTNSKTKWERKRLIETSSLLDVQSQPRHQDWPSNLQMWWNWQSTNKFKKEAAKQEKAPSSTPVSGAN